jgi:L-lactate dehydrogenase (cytochrome)
MRILSQALSLDDFETLSRRHLPRPIFGYVAGATERNASLRDNEAAFTEWRFVPACCATCRSARPRGRCSARNGRRRSGLAPMGMSALAAYRGDLVLARAAREAGVPMIMSGSSLIRMEEVIAENPDAWFQAYLPGDSRRVEALVDRVQAAGFRTLALTVDTAVLPNRENNVRNGFSTPLRPSLRLAWDGLTRPRWLLGTWARTLKNHGMPHFENSFAERGAPILASNVLRDFTARDHLNWEHLALIRRRWKGTLIVKGVMHAEDAKRAQEEGAEGVILGNHGGRQLDGTASPLRVLPEVLRAAPGLVVMLDGGIRRGTDVLKALALGAHFVFVGRPMLHAAAVAGPAGASHAIAILQAEIERNMALLGCDSLDELGPEWLVRV